jgi:hypothetical protein
MHNLTWALQPQWLFIGHLKGRVVSSVLEFQYDFTASRDQCQLISVYGLVLERSAIVHEFPHALSDLVVDSSVLKFKRCSWSSEQSLLDSEIKITLIIVSLLLLFIKVHLTIGAGLGFNF